MIEVLQVLEQHLYSFDGSLVLVFGERPEDLGVIWREEDGVKMHPASIWQLPVPPFRRQQLALVHSRLQPVLLECSL